VRKFTLFILAAAVAVLSAATPVASARVPFGFVGMNVDGPLLSGGMNLDTQFGAMARGGVESVRVAIYWGEVQPKQGNPPDLTGTDRIVEAAASHGIDVLPVVLEAPSWDARHPGSFASPPASPEPYAGFLTALVDRYGPQGSFWSEHPSVPRVPIRDWQIWNEPDSTTYWSDQPFVGDYVALLKASYQALKQADPGARLVLAGFPSRSWVSLARLYAAGAQPYFDVAAAHPFSLPVSNVARILAQDRRVMAKFHDKKKPFFVTETSWPSAKGKTTTTYGFEVTPAGQAAKARAVLKALARFRKALKVKRVYWYTWASLDESRTAPFDYAGLLTLGPNETLLEKPAFQTFTSTALKIEGCRSKGALATNCNH
jgi:hypothetical protein